MRTKSGKKQNDLTALVFILAAVCCAAPLVILFLVAGGLSSILGVLAGNLHFVAAGILLFMVGSAWASYKLRSKRKEVKQKWEY